MDFVLVYNHHNLCLNFCSFSCTGIRHNHFMEVKYILLQGAILFSENNWFHHEKSIRRERERPFAVFTRMGCLLNPRKLHKLACCRNFDAANYAQKLK